MKKFCLPYKKKTNKTTSIPTKKTVAVDIELFEYSTHNLNESYAQKIFNLVTISMNFSINTNLDASETWYAISRILTDGCSPEKTFYFPVSINGEYCTIGRITNDGEITFLNREHVYEANTPIICNFSYFV